MKRGPIGVWFSAALVILGLSAWGGVYAGQKFARYRFFRKQQEIESSYSPERARLESELSKVRQLEYVRLLVSAARTNRKVEKEYLVAVIAGLERQTNQSGQQEIKSVIDLNLGLAYVELALAEEQDGNKEQAEKDMKSAQPIFQSLGWKDYSDEALKAAAQYRLDKWTAKPREMAPEK